LKQVSGFKWDEENGADINSNTLPVWNTYIDVCALSTLYYFTHHNIYPEVPKGCTLQNKGLAVKIYLLASIFVTLMEMCRDGECE
jgi:hypothetical protein